MVNIRPLQQQWQHERDLIQHDETSAFSQNQEYKQKLGAIEERLKNAHGLSRLKKPFIRATRITWLHHKQNKIKRNVAKKERYLSATAANILSALGETVAKSSSQSADFARLQTAIRHVKDVQSVVDDAASQCSSASSTEMFTAGSNQNPGMDYLAKARTRDAANAAKNAEQAVRNLQQTLRHEISQVNGAYADSILRSNDMTFWMDMCGGGTFLNWRMSGKLNEAENHLRTISGNLAKEISKLVQTKEAIVKTELAQARRSDNEIEKFAAELENYKLPPSMRQSPENAKKSGLRLIKRRHDL